VNIIGKKILVTGGTGFIGSYLIERLVSNGNEIIVFDNGFRAGFDNVQKFKDKISIINGDVTNLEDWKKIPKDVEFAYHLAAINGTKYFYEIPEKVIDVNVRGTLNFFDWVKDTDVKRIFFASSSEVYGFPKKFPTPETEPLSVPEPKNPRFSYSSSKIIGETITINFSRENEIDYSIARFHNVYGPRMGFEHVMPEFIRMCVNNEKFIMKGSGEETRCFCYISDAIDGVLLLADHPKAKNDVFNIGTNQEVTINNLIELLSKIHGKQINSIKKDFENPGTNRRIPDISKISKLGYNPKISLEDGFKKTYEWYKQYYLH